jgi:hypothetical protein
MTQLRNRIPASCRRLRLTEQILNTIRFQQTDAQILEVSRRLTVEEFSD